MSDLRNHPVDSGANASVAALAVAASIAAVLAIALSWTGAAGTEDARGSGSLRQGGVNISAETGRLTKAPRFGHRVLEVGMVGRDVGVLQAMVRSKAARTGRTLFAPGPVFDAGTERAVKRYQSRIGLKPTGIVTRKTSEELKSEMGRAGASWYGPGFYGNRTACGQRLRPSTVGVAHKTLSCGSQVLIGYKGRYLLTRVIDRGPFIAGRSWDLTNGARIALGYQGIDPVRYLVAAER